MAERLVGLLDDALVATQRGCCRHLPAAASKQQAEEQAEAGRASWAIRRIAPRAAGSPARAGWGISFIIQQVNNNRPRAPEPLEIMSY